MTDRLLQEQQVARLLGRAAELQEQAAKQGEEDGGEGAEAPAGTYRLAEIQAAAAEAGIDAQFVALAALELAAADSGGSTALTPVQRHSAARWLGAREPGLRHEQRFAVAIDPLLAAIGVTVQAPHYGLRIAESTPDMRRGGTMLLAVPEVAVTTSGGLNMFAYYLRGVFDIEHLRMTITPRGAGEQEVSVAVDLAQAWPGTVVWARTIAAIFVGLGAAVGWGIAAGLALGMVSTLMIAAVLGVAAGRFGLHVNRWWYAHAVRKAQQQLREVLRDVDGALRSQAVFGVLPPSAPAAPTQGAADANIVPVIVDV